MASSDTTAADGATEPAPRGASVSPAAPQRRTWFRSIGGKLLIAFGLIAALTIGSTFLSLFRFNQVEVVLHGLTGVSMPALKLSMDVQSRAAEVIETAGEVGNAQDEVERFNGMSTATERIGNLWQAIERLRTVIADEQRMVPIQQLIAQIDREVGELNRTVGDGLAASQAPGRAFREVGTANDAATVRIGAMLERLQAALPGAAGAPATAEMQDTQRASQLLARLHDLRGDFNDAVRVLNNVRQANTTEALNALRSQFDAIFQRIREGVASFAQVSLFPPDTIAALNTAADHLATHSTGAGGIFALRTEYLKVRTSIATITTALKQDGTKLRETVAGIVADAEEQATRSQQLSVSAITTSRVWLLLIALATLVIAGLIVWLFVHRYVVSRLDSLAESMLAIARGNLDAPVPAAGSDELGEMSRALAVFRDNAREIQTARDQAVKARAEAEAASRAKSTFLANMSHELRTPLNAIIGYSEILAEDATDRGDDMSVQDLQKIQAAGKHLLGLINSILDLSKIEAGRMDVYLEAVNVPQLIEEVRVIVQPLIEKNGNRLNIDCPADIGAMRTDLTKVKQSLINLLSNAAKFTDKGDVGLSVARHAGPAGEPFVQFKVSDSGIGMSEEQMGRLFEAFAQADSSTTRNFGGTGLGLAITRRFATMLGGNVTVTSKPGEGSVFTIDLLDQAAAAPAAARGAAKAAVSEGDATALSVLVVDDDPAVHEVLSATLGKKGYRVLHAHDGAQALEVLKRSPPDVVTLDVMMPNVDGWSVLGTMKSDPALAHIPVIMLTIVDDRNFGFSLGAAEYMTKPVDRDRLLTLVRRFASRKDNSVVLVVDDDPEVRDIVGTTLRKEGLGIAEAVNGRAALEWLDAHPLPDLVLLDLMMPEMDGFEFLEKLRDNPELAQVPVVVLTARSLTAEERSFLAERTVLVLGKSAQPLATLGTALAAIATRQSAGAAGPGSSSSASRLSA